MFMLYVHVSHVCLLDEMNYQVMTLGYGGMME